MDDLAKSLSNATRIVTQYVLGRINASEFIKRYSNFYYYEALDGHEASSSTSEREKYWIAIELHKKIQFEVVNKIMIGSSSKEFLMEAGRISEAEAREHAQAICAEKGLDAILELLGN